MPLDWVRGTLRGMKADYAWSKEPDIAAWLDGSRLNLARGSGAAVTSLGSARRARATL